jgi:hypothetical protein
LVVVLVVLMVLVAVQVDLAVVQDKIPVQEEVLEHQDKDMLEVLQRLVLQDVEAAAAPVVQVHLVVVIMVALVEMEFHLL